MDYLSKKKLAQPKSQTGQLAKALSLSLYPKHVGLLRQRERELNIHRSILMQLLLNIESRYGLLRREINARLKNPSAGRRLQIKFL